MDCSNCGAKMEVLEEGDDFIVWGCSKCGKEHTQYI